VNWGPLECPHTSALKGKTKQKPPEVEEARKGKPHNRENTGHHGRGAHHGLTVAATTARGVHHGLAVVATVVVARLFSPVRRVLVIRCFTLGRGFCLFLGLLGLFASLF